MGSPIEFKTYADYAGIIPDVVPARKVLPQWYKEMEGGYTPTGKIAESSTVKRCVPFMDSMMMGYIIPLWADFHCKTDQTSANITSKWNDLVTPHTAKQIESTPFGKFQFGKNPLKFNSPWYIKTEPGWSVLITAPFNQGPVPFHIFTGLVDTDTYHGHVNFPFVWMEPDFDGLVKAGTPIAQVIPFKRDDLETQSIIGVLDETDLLNIRRTSAQLNVHMKHAYRQEHWVKKTNT